MKIDFMETSAKGATNVTKAFTLVASTLHHAFAKQLSVPESIIINGGREVDSLETAKSPRFKINTAEVQKSTLKKKRSRYRFPESRSPLIDVARSSEEHCCTKCLPNGGTLTTFCPSQSRF